jgi:hypothetical protein
MGRRRIVVPQKKLVLLHFQLDIGLYKHILALRGISTDGNLRRVDEELQDVPWKSGHLSQYFVLSTSSGTSCYNHTCPIRILPDYIIFRQSCMTSFLGVALGYMPEADQYISKQAP